MAFARWIFQAIARLWRSSTKPAPPQTPISSTTRRGPLPLRQIPLGSARRPSAVIFWNLPYQKAPELVTRGEQAIWYSIERAVEGKYRLFCKVRLADIVCCPKENRNEGYWFRKISRYHVDFVICDLKTTAPLLVVELDDRRHREHLRKKQDEFKDAALNAAGVPVYRIAARAAYDVEELKKQIERLIAIC